MNINGVPPVGAVTTQTPTAPAAAPESGEAPGARDNDGDAEDVRPSAPASASSTPPGHVNVRV